MALLLQTHCAKETPSETETQSTDPPSDTTVTSVVTAPFQCTQSVLDYGQKGSLAAIGRGLYSDTKMIPGSSRPALAYIDQGSINLKFTYWNGSGFFTEVVSGEGSGSFVRLAFLSTGVPLIFWSQGGNLKVAIRSAPVGSEGTWNAGIVDAGTAPRAIEVSVNPLNQVGVTFLTGTTTAGRPKFLYCDSPCTTPAGFFTMNPNPYTDNTNILAAQMGTGISWCKASDQIYYPAIAYSVTGISRYAVCRNTLQNCLDSSNWNTQNVAATASVSNKLLIDPSITGDTPKVVSLGPSGVVTYRMGTTACTADPSAFTAGATLGTASTGTQWVSLLKDASGKFHIVANEGTTGVRYYNSTGTDINGSWNAAGLVDTTTLAAGSRGGSDIDNMTGGIYVSYGQNIAPFDIRMARINDYNAPSGSASFSRFIPDLTGNIQLTGANSQQRNISLASTSSKYLGLAYIDFSAGSVANAKLKYSYRSTNSARSSWETFNVPGTTNPQFPSLAFDQNDKPWIAYFEASTNRFFLTSNSETNGSGSWQSYEFPSIPAGAPSALPSANNTAVSMYYQPGVSKPTMAIVDSNVTSKGIKVATLNPLLGTWSTVSIIDSLTGSGAAAHISMDHDTLGNRVIGYYSMSTTRARYSASTDGVTWSAPIDISLINQGIGASIKLNPVTHSPSMTYYDRANNALYYSSCSGTVTACAAGGWNPVAIDMTTGVSGLAVGNEQLLSSSLVFDSTGVAYVIYPRGQGSTGNLMLATNSSGAFETSNLAPGTNGTLQGTNALNFAISGWNASASLNSLNSISSAFVGPGNWLYFVSCRD